MTEVALNVPSRGRKAAPSLPDPRAARRTRRRGNALVEFTLVGVPLIFILISTVEVARGMWQYHTLAYAVKAGARYAVVHGQDCTIAPNSCTVSISQIATVIRNAGVGMPAESLTMTFTPWTGAATTCALNDCIATYTSGYWPPAGANAPGRNVRISATYPFRSIITMFWPGAGQASAMGVFTLSAAARESIQF